MTRAEIYTMLTVSNGLLSGVQIDETIFENLLDIVQMQYEGMRPWVYLRAENSSQTASPSDSFTTGKTLPTDFARWYDEAPIQLVDASNNPLPLLEIPFSQRFQYRSSAGRFAVDYPNSLLYIMGSATQAYTIRQNYIKVSTLVSSAAEAQWVFPVRFHKILALSTAVYWRKGIDYDVFNNIQGDAQAAQAAMMYDVMSRWDSSLQKSMQRGKDPFDTNSIGPGGPSGGVIRM